MPATLRQSRRAAAIELEEALLALLVADRRISSINPAPYADVVLGVAGLTRAGVVACETLFLQGCLLVLAVPSLAWADEATKATTLRIARTLRRHDLRVVLVPERVIRREPRLSNSRLIASCSGLAVSPRDRMAVMTRLLEEGGATLSDCAEVVRATDRYGSVLSMAAAGLITIDMRQPLLPWSEVRQAGRD